MKITIENPEPYEHFESEEDLQRRKQLVTKILIDGYTSDLSPENGIALANLIVTIVEEASKGISAYQREEATVSRIKQQPEFLSRDLPHFEGDLVKHIVQQINVFWIAPIELLPFFEIGKSS